MEMIIHWLTMIIFFLLLASVIDMLIPSSSYQPYIKMVIGLIFIIFLLQPIFYLFQLDPKQLVEKVMKESTVDEQSLQTKIENQKREIQASQDAYILEQMEVQMVKQVERELKKKYGIKISSLHLDVEKTSQTIHGVEAVVEPMNKSAVEPIEIGRTKEREKPPLPPRLKSFLAIAWGIDEEAITVRWKESW